MCNVRCVRTLNYSSCKLLMVAKAVARVEILLQVTHCVLLLGNGHLLSTARVDYYSFSKMWFNLYNVRTEQMLMKWKVMISFSVHSLTLTSKYIMCTTYNVTAHSLCGVTRFPKERAKKWNYNVHNGQDIQTQHTHSSYGNKLQVTLCAITKTFRIKRIVKLVGHTSHTHTYMGDGQEK